MQQKGFLVCLLITFACASFSPRGKEKVPESIVFETSLGSVTFDHVTHREYTKNWCATCHHTRDPGERQRCRTCHKGKIATDEDDPPSFWDVKMNLCRGCHRERNAAGGESNAPVDCMQCHSIKKVSDYRN